MHMDAQQRLCQLTDTFAEVGLTLCVVHDGFHPHVGHSLLAGKVEHLQRLVLSRRVQRGRGAEMVGTVLSALLGAWYYAWCLVL